MAHDSPEFDSGPSRNILDFAAKSRDAALRAAQMGQQAYQFGIDTQLKQQQMQQAAAQFQQSQGLQQQQLAQQGQFQQGELANRRDQMQQQNQQFGQTQALGYARLGQEGQLANQQQQQHLMLAQQQQADRTERLSQQQMDFDLNHIARDRAAEEKQYEGTDTGMPEARSAFYAQQEDLAKQRHLERVSKNNPFAQQQAPVAPPPPVAPPAPQPPAFGLPTSVNPFATPNDPSSMAGQQTPVAAKPEEADYGSKADNPPMYKDLDHADEHQGKVETAQSDVDAAGDKLQKAVESGKNVQKANASFQTAVQKHDAVSPVSWQQRLLNSEQTVQTLADRMDKFQNGNQERLTSAQSKALSLQYANAQKDNKKLQTQWEAQKKANSSDGAWDKFISEMESKAKQAQDFDPQLSSKYDALARAATMQKSAGETRYNDFAQQFDPQIKVADTAMTAVRTQDLMTKAHQKINTEFKDDDEAAMQYASRLNIPQEAKDELIGSLPSQRYAKTIMASVRNQFPVDPSAPTAEQATTLAQHQFALGVEKAKLSPQPPTEKQLAENPQLLDFVNELLANSESTRSMQGKITRTSNNAGVGGGVSLNGIGLSGHFSHSWGDATRTADTTIRQAIADAWKKDVYQPAVGHMSPIQVAQTRNALDGTAKGMLQGTPTQDHTDAVNARDPGIPASMQPPPAPNRAPNRDEIKATMQALTKPAPGTSFDYRPPGEQFPDEPQFHTNKTAADLQKQSGIENAAADAKAAGSTPWETAKAVGGKLWDLNPGTAAISAIMHPIDTVKHDFNTLVEINPVTQVYRAYQKMSDTIKTGDVSNMVRDVPGFHAWLEAKQLGAKWDKLSTVDKINLGTEFGKDIIKEGTAIAGVAMPLAEGMTAKGPAVAPVEASVAASEADAAAVKPNNLEIGYNTEGRQIVNGAPDRGAPKSAGAGLTQLQDAAAAGKQADIPTQIAKPAAAPANDPMSLFESQQAPSSPPEFADLPQHGGPADQSTVLQQIPPREAAGALHEELSPFDSRPVDSGFIAKNRPGPAVNQAARRGGLEAGMRDVPVEAKVNALSNELGRTPTPNEVASKLGVSKEAAKVLIQDHLAAKPVTSAFDSSPVNSGFVAKAEPFEPVVNQGNPNQQQAPQPSPFEQTPGLNEAAAQPAPPPPMPEPAPAVQQGPANAGSPSISQIEKMPPGPARDQALNQAIREATQQQQARVNGTPREAALKQAMQPPPEAAPAKPTSRAAAMEGKLGNAEPPHVKATKAVLEELSAKDPELANELQIHWAARDTARGGAGVGTMSKQIAALKKAGLPADLINRTGKYADLHPGKAQ